MRARLFVGLYALAIQSIAMVGSPFHGIFRSQKDAGEGKSIFSFGQSSSQSLPVTNEDSSAVAGKMAVDILQYEDNYVIIAPIAGVTLSDLDIDTSGQRITIRGKRRSPVTAPDDQYYVQECFWGSFERTITLPVPIDPRKVRAVFGKDCTLRITIPKEPKVKIVKVETE
jgi:HSP20 family protein